VDAAEWRWMRPSKGRWDQAGACSRAWVGRTERRWVQPSVSGHRWVLYTYQQFSFLSVLLCNNTMYIYQTNNTYFHLIQHSLDEEKLWVRCIPRVSYHTAEITGWYAPVPAMGTVYAGMGTVWENRTRGIPVWNPTDRNSILDA
jgi:hypothetical protein